MRQLIYCTNNGTDVINLRSGEEFDDCFRRCLEEFGHDYEDVVAIGAHTGNEGIIFAYRVYLPEGELIDG